ncbi:MAG: hypothetical protein WC590_08480 [Burkholderiaceae bacterium]
MVTPITLPTTQSTREAFARRALAKKNALFTLGEQGIAVAHAGTDQL